VNFQCKKITSWKQKHHFIEDFDCISK